MLSYWQIYQDSDSVERRSGGLGTSALTLAWLQDEARKLWESTIEAAVYGLAKGWTALATFLGRRSRLSPNVQVLALRIQQLQKLICCLLLGIKGLLQHLHLVLLLKAFGLKPCKLTDGRSCATDPHRGIIGGPW